MINHSPPRSIKWGTRMRSLPGLPRKKMAPMQASSSVPWQVFFSRHGKSGETWPWRFGIWEMPFASWPFQHGHFRIQHGDVIYDILGYLLHPITIPIFRQREDRNRNWPPVSVRSSSDWWLLPSELCIPEPRGATTFRDFGWWVV